jgi:hypothetical protein
MKLDIPGALRDLDRLVDRMAELLEWQKLVQQERRGPFTSFELNHHLPGDIRTLHARFLNAHLDLREVLGRPNLEASPRQRRRWEQRLQEIEHRFASLPFTGRFIYR